MRGRATHRGSTLVEVMVYASLFGLVLAMVHAFFLYGRAYYEVSRHAMDLQQTANLLGQSLAVELAQSNVNGVEFYPNASAATAPVGVVFLSARDGAGNFTYDENTGAVTWRRYVGYYLDTDPENPTSTEVQALFRAEVVPSSFPTTDVVAGSAQSPPVTTAFIKANGANRRIVAHGARVASSTLPHGGFDIYALDSGSKTYDAAANPVVLDLELYAQAAIAGTSAAKVNRVTSRLEVRCRN